MFNKTIPRNQNKNFCATCIRRCCDRMPGILHPSQLKKVTVESIAQLLEIGYAIDWWEGDAREEQRDTRRLKNRRSVTYYIRPGIKGFENKVFHGAWGGSCVFLTETGCKFNFQDRPLECQELIPNKHHACTSNSKIDGKRLRALQWIKYQDIIIEAGNRIQSTKPQMTNEEEFKQSIQQLGKAFNISNDFVELITDIGVHGRTESESDGPGKQV